MNDHFKPYTYIIHILTFLIKPIETYYIILYFYFNWSPSPP